MKAVIKDVICLIAVKEIDIPEGANKENILQTECKKMNVDPNYFFIEIV